MYTCINIHSGNDYVKPFPSEQTHAAGRDPNNESCCHSVLNQIFFVKAQLTPKPPTLLNLYIAHNTFFRHIIFSCAA